MQFDVMKFYREFPQGGGDEPWLKRCLEAMCTEYAKELAKEGTPGPSSPTKQIDLVLAASVDLPKEQRETIAKAVEDVLNEMWLRLAAATGGLVNVDTQYTVRY